MTRRTKIVTVSSVTLGMLDGVIAVFVAAGWSDAEIAAAVGAAIREARGEDGDRVA